MRYRLTFVCGVIVGYVLGTRAGRERYEQLRKAAQNIISNPAVRNTAETAGMTGRAFAVKAADAVAGKMSDRLPESVTERVRYLREHRTAAEDGWGSSTR